MTQPTSLSLRLVRLLATRDAIDAAGGLLDFYTGTPPSGGPQAGTTEVLLVTIALVNPSGSIGNVGDLGRYVVSCPRVGSALATGLIGWCRVNDGAGAGFMDLLVGLEGDGFPVVVSSKQVYEGGELQLISCVMTE